MPRRFAAACSARSRSARSSVPPALQDAVLPALLVAAAGPRRAGRDARSRAAAPPAGTRRGGRAPRSGAAGPGGARAASRRTTLRTEPRRNSVVPPIDVAPASVGQLDDLATCSGASLMPGISGAIRMPVGMPARLSSATASSRARGFGVCGSVARQAFSSSVGTDRHALTSATSRDLLQQVQIAQQQRRLGQDRARVARVAQRLPDPAHQLVAPLDPLVRVGVRAQRDVLALPRRPRQLRPQHLRHVDLDDDLALEVPPGVEAEVLVRRAGEAVEQAWEQPRYGLTVQLNGSCRPGRGSTRTSRGPRGSGCRAPPGRRTCGRRVLVARELRLACFRRSCSCQRTNVCSHTSGTECEGLIVALVAPVAVHSGLHRVSGERHQRHPEQAHGDEADRGPARRSRARRGRGTRRRRTPPP